MPSCGTCKAPNNRVLFAGSALAVAIERYCLFLCRPLEEGISGPADPPDVPCLDKSPCVWNIAENYA